MERIVLFDGVCNLCEGVVQTIVAVDSANVFKFASLQSEAAQPLIKACGIPEEEIMNSFIMVERTPGFIPNPAGAAQEEGSFTFYRASTAALQIGRHLDAPFSLLAPPALLLPAFVRDAVYYCVARNRYLMFGKKTTCMRPTKALKAKFLDWGEQKKTAAPAAAPAATPPQPPADGMRKRARSRGRSSSG